MLWRYGAVQRLARLSQHTHDLLMPMLWHIMNGEISDRPSLRKVIAKLFTQVFSSSVTEKLFDVNLLLRPKHSLIVFVGFEILVFRTQ